MRWIVNHNKVTEMMSVSHRGNSSVEPEAAPEKKPETESKTLPIVASISCRSCKSFSRPEIKVMP